MLIRDLAVFKTLIPTITGKSIDKYAQPLANAQQWLSSQIVGCPLMARIEDTENEETPSPIFHLARLVVAYKAYLFAIPQMDILETDNGFAIVNDDRLAPASRDRVQALAKSMESSLNDSIALLIEQLEDSPDLHSLWSTAPAFSLMYDSYIPTLRMFRRYGTFAGSYFDFISATPIIRGIIIKSIESRISQEFSAEILMQLKCGELSESNNMIIGDLRYSLAAYYNGDIQLGDTSLYRVCRIIEAMPDEYPAFKNSELYQSRIRHSKKEGCPHSIALWL